MNACRIQHYTAGRLFWLLLAAGFILRSGTVSAVEEKFEVLQIGARTYNNVTVTTKAKNYVFILHDGGMASIKPAELPLEIQDQLGYAPGGGTKSPTNTAVAWAKKEIAKIDVPQVKDLGKQVEQTWRGQTPVGLPNLGLAGPALILAVLGIVLLLHLFYCYCWMLICRKTGNPGGVMVWLPVLQIFPMLRAAGMSGWWSLGFCVPVLNLITVILFCFNIAKARCKSAWVGFFLLLPITSLFAFLYLAFSNGASKEENEESGTRIMTLETI